MSPAILLPGYCALIVAVSLAGGWAPILVRPTHARMEVALSFVSGVMLGVALLHLLPLAAAERTAWPGAVAAAPPGGEAALDPVVRWLVAGFVAMFLLERSFCFHHHDLPEDGGEGDGHVPLHRHRLTWTGAAVGLTVHALIAGMALAASVGSESSAAPGTVAGLGTFLVIALHKPFDALTIGTLMAAGRRSRRARHVVNALFSLAVPFGAVLFFAGAAGGEAAGGTRSAALAFSAGTFLCISLSDLLPELQFHQHDRLKLSLALLAGLALAWGLRLIEGG